MEYFLIYKTDKLVKIDAPIELSRGFKFAKKTTITLYNKGIIDYILTKKINKNLREIINLYLQYINQAEEGETDADAQAILEAKVEFLRNALFKNYAPFLDRKAIEDYVIKLEKMEAKIANIPSKKRVM